VHNAQSARIPVRQRIVPRIRIPIPLLRIGHRRADVQGIHDGARVRQARGTCERIHVIRRWQASRSSAPTLFEDVRRHVPVAFAPSPPRTVLPSLLDCKLSLRYRVALSELGMTANPPTRGVFYRVVLALGVALVAACSNQQSPTGPSSTPPPAPGGQTAACSFSVAGAGTEREVDAAGAAFTLDVTASRADCTWTATSAAPFISTNPAGATGTASIDVLVARNSEAARTGEVTVAGYSLTVRQRAAQAPSMCGAIVSPTAVRVSADGGTTQIAVTNVAKFCAWTASTDAPFLRLTSRLPQEGDGSVRWWSREHS
jgi:hypothetical protein